MRFTPVLAAFLTGLAAPALAYALWSGPVRNGIIDREEAATVEIFSIDAFNQIGSGFIVSPDGDVVTVNHVVSAMSESGLSQGQDQPQPKLLVRLHNNDVYPAKVVGTDPATDLAVLRISTGKPLPFASFGWSSALHVGDRLTAIGHPFGLPQTVTSGIVSALHLSLPNRFIDCTCRIVQTDTALNPGNSGGPLFNQYGNVVGIADTILSPAANDGLSFAIASDQAAAEVNEIRRYGHTTPGELGFVPHDRSRPRLGAPDGPGGAVVSDLTGEPESGGSGIEPGDIIVGFDGAPVATAKDLEAATYLTRPGEKVPVEIIRGGKPLHVAFVMSGSRPALSAQVAYSSTPPRRSSPLPPWRERSARGDG